MLAAAGVRFVEELLPALGRAVPWCDRLRIPCDDVIYAVVVPSSHAESCVPSAPSRACQRRRVVRADHMALQAQRNLTYSCQKAVLTPDK